MFGSHLRVELRLRLEISIQSCDGEATPEQCGFRAKRPIRPKITAQCPSCHRNPSDQGPP